MSNMYCELQKDKDCQGCLLFEFMILLEVCVESLGGIVCADNSYS